MLKALYDGQCRVCQATRRLVEALDWRHRVEFLDLHAPQTRQASGIALDAERLMGAIHVLDGSGRVYAGYDGLRRMLRELPLCLPIWLLLRLPGIDGLGRRGYRFVARHRYRMSRWLGSPSDCAADRCRL